jgi:hypothetical protein
MKDLCYKYTYMWKLQFLGLILQVTEYFLDETDKNNEVNRDSKITYNYYQSFLLPSVYP